MRERPPLADRDLAAAVAAGWGVAAASVEFLPVGDDSRAWSFRVVADDSRRWFLKVRRGSVDRAAVVVPRFLRDHGLAQVVAAIPAGDGNPWRQLGGFTVLLYPWVDGVPAMERGLTGRLWAELGRFVAALHRTRLPAALAATVAEEPFVPWGARPVRALDGQIGRARPDDPLGRELDEFWRAHREEIRFAADRAERLGRVVADARPRLVLCHADLHTANLLVDADDRLFVVDWDGVQLAPAERDLLFVATGEEQARFFDGYGPVTLDPAVVTYFRWEWVVQELADYGGRVLEGRLGEDTRRHALEEFRRLFTPGDLVDTARQADRQLKLR